MCGPIRHTLIYAQTHLLINGELFENIRTINAKLKLISLEEHASFPQMVTVAAVWAHIIAIIITVLFVLNATEFNSVVAMFAWYTYSRTQLHL